jgi:hypothetical protein
LSRTRDERAGKRRAGESARQIPPKFPFAERRPLATDDVRDEARAMFVGYRDDGGVGDVGMTGQRDFDLARRDHRTVHLDA